jgi:pimeloyl-[acyl-carrier protein] methyl ester esterase
VPDLVLLHGWGTHPVIWEPLSKPLSKSWHIINLPLPGYAGAETVANYGIDELAEALVERVPEKSVVMGWSLGGMVAMRLAYRWPGKVRHLVLIGSTPCFVARSDWPYGVAPDVFEGFAQNLTQDYEGTLRRFLALQAQGTESMREVLRELRIRLLALPRASDATLQGGLNILQEADLRQGLPSISATIIHGTGDRLAPLGAAYWLTDQFANAQLFEVRDAGHAPFLSHPAEVASCIDALAND